MSPFSTHSSKALEELRNALSLDSKSAFASPHWLPFPVSFWATDWVRNKSSYSRMDED